MDINYIDLQTCEEKYDPVGPETPSEYTRERVWGPPKEYRNPTDAWLQLMTQYVKRHS